MSDISNFDGGEPVYRYTRAQAIADGVLADVSAIHPREVEAAGIVVPVAMTAAAFAAAISPIPDADGDASSRLADSLIAAGECFNERARRVLHAYAYSVARRRAPDAGPFSIAVTVLHAPNDWREVDLKCVASAGDEGEPVLTIMLPDED